MKAYYYDDLPGDQRLPHISTTTSSSSPIIPTTHLSHLGVETYHHPMMSSVDDLASSRGYKHRDEITISPQAMGSSETYHQKLQMFFQEHMHEDEEIRYILDGTGYFDVRGDDEKWVRIQVERGDLIVLPAGIWHRFTTDEGDYIKAMRLFRDEPKWTPLNRNREMENNPYRVEYVRSRSMKAGGASSE